MPEFHAAILHLPPSRPTDYPDSHSKILRFTGPLFPFTLTDRGPDSIRATLLGTPLWRVLFTMAMAGFIGLITFFWSRFSARFWPFRGSVGEVARRASVPILLFLLIYSIIIALPSIPKQSYDAHLLRLLARVLGVLIGAGILRWGANELGIPAAGMLAGLGVGGFALALAAQSTIENLFGGVSIFADRPFRVGDFIRYGQSDGIVEMIGPRSTRIRGLDGTLTSVPNADTTEELIPLLFSVLFIRYRTKDRSRTQASN